MERGTFQDSAAKLFNVLPANIRNCSDFKVYCREVTATNVLSREKAQWGCDCGIIGNETGYVLCHTEGH